MVGEEPYKDLVRGFGVMVNHATTLSLVVGGAGGDTMGTGCVVAIQLEKGLNHIGWLKDSLNFGSDRQEGRPYLAILPADELHCRFYGLQEIGGCGSLSYEPVALPMVTPCPLPDPPSHINVVCLFAANGPPSLFNMLRLFFADEFYPFASRVMICNNRTKVNKVYLSVYRGVGVAIPQN